ncbi:hypothetical protein V2J09_011894 [Rumex salicifolius]
MTNSPLHLLSPSLLRFSLHSRTHKLQYLQHQQSTKSTSKTRFIIDSATTLITIPEKAHKMGNWTKSFTVS